MNLILSIKFQWTSLLILSALLNHRHNRSSLVSQVGFWATEMKPEEGKSALTASRFGSFSWLEVGGFGLINLITVSIVICKYYCQTTGSNLAAVFFLSFVHFADISSYFYFMNLWFWTTVSSCNQKWGKQKRNSKETVNLTLKLVPHGVGPKKQDRKVNI